MELACARCREWVDVGNAYIRSVNFRQVAWCESCWRAMHEEPVIPAQRSAPAAERAERRWFSRRQ